jgi:hypothetical protein
MAHSALRALLLKQLANLSDATGLELILGEHVSCATYQVSLPGLQKRCSPAQTDGLYTPASPRDCVREVPNLPDVPGVSDGPAVAGRRLAAMASVCSICGCPWTLVSVV